MIWKGRRLKDYGDLIWAVSGCESPHEAQEFRDLYAQENPHARSNIGHVLGELDREDFERLVEWFGCPHPVFGTRYPTPSEAFELGCKMITQPQGNGLGGNPWFVGALENL